jgi:aromatase
MEQLDYREAEHQVTVSAPAATVYRLIAEVENWPLIFPPTVYVDYVERSGDGERIRIWATANGAAKNWTSARVLDPVGLRIDFRQEVSTPPVAAMGGSWLIEPISEGECRVRLLHDYRAVDNDQDNISWIEEAIDHNSRSELAALKDSAEMVAATADDLMLSFEDTLQVDGSAKDMYDFINEAQHWKQRLPHVVRVSLTEDTPGLQILEMDTSTKDGATHTTKSVRVCFPHSKIVYKQITLPALMTLHTGRWHFTDNGDRVTATSQHTVVLNPATITKILGADAGVPEAREFIRSALGTNSRATLRHAKQYAEARR